MINPLKFLIYSSTVIRKFTDNTYQIKSAHMFMIALTEQKDVESVTALFFQNHFFLFKFVKKVTKIDKVLRT